MTKELNRQWILAKRPQGDIADGDLVFQSNAIPTAATEEIVVKTAYLSLDPTNRIWMSDMDGYMPPVDLNAPMRGLVAGIVTESKSKAFKKGDMVMGIGTWSDYCVAPASSFIAIPSISGISPRDIFAIYYLVGPTAYFGLVDVTTPKIGETLVVSTAAGAVGSLVGQIGKALGCRVVGIAGGKDKCDWITNELGFDAAIDYKSQDVASELRRHCPNGIDIYYENVGGKILDAVLPQMNLFGRISVCGLISSYNATEPQPGPYNYHVILMQRLKVQGFIILDYFHRYPEAFRALTELRLSGKLKWRLQEVNGLEEAEKTVRLLYAGGNTGKLLIKISDF